MDGAIVVNLRHVFGINGVWPKKSGTDRKEDRSSDKHAEPDHTTVAASRSARTLRPTRQKCHAAHRATTESVSMAYRSDSRPRAGLKRSLSTPTICGPSPMPIRFANIMTSARDVARV